MPKIKKSKNQKTEKPKKRDLKSLMDDLKNEGLSVKKASDLKKQSKIPTGLFALDYVLDGGISIAEGGFRLELSGDESSGKTTLSLLILKKFQKMGKFCAFINAERSYDTEWADILGIDNDKVIIEESETLEEAGESLIKMVKKGVEVIIVDGITSLIPMVVDTKRLDEPTMGIAAKVNSVLCTKLYKELKGKTTIIVFINQVREKIGGYGNPIMVTGGRALRFFYHARIKLVTVELITEDIKNIIEGVKKQEKLKESENTKKKKQNDEKVITIGKKIKMDCFKNKKGKPHRKSIVEFYFDGHFDNNISILYMAIRYGIVEKTGAWFSYKEKKAQGVEGMKNMLSDEDYVEIEKKLWEVIK